jgi:hypothetical protein
MQTSFMHPPFGFALFYLRGIADQIYKNGAIDRPIESRDIYLGAIPWVVMQLMLVAVVIFWPGSVTYWLDKEQVINTDDVKIDVQIQDTAEPEVPTVLPEAAPASSAPASGAEGAVPGLPVPAPDEAGSNANAAVSPADNPADDPTKAVQDAISKGR